jgi:hypothetical protein
LAAGVGVVDELDVGPGLAAGQGHAQRVEHEVGAHVCGELPAHDAAAVGVDDEAEEHQALPAAQVGEVRQPQLIGSAGAEVAVDQIGRAHRGGVGHRGPPGLAAPLGALDRGLAHQALDAVAPDLVAGPPQRLPRAPVAVGVVVGRMGRADELEQPLVLDAPLRARARGALVVGGRRHAQGPADRLDPEALALLVDERAHFVRSWSSSVAKNTDAALRISFARRSS